VQSYSHNDRRLARRELSLAVTALMQVRGKR